MRDRNAYENSSVWNMVSEIKQDEYINSLSPGMRNYLMYLLEDIERRKNTNCYYVSESTLNTLNNDLGYIRDYLSSSSLESYIDRAFEHLASFWPAHNGRRVVDIAQSTYNHYVDEAEKRIKEIRDQADKIDSLKDEFDDFLESTKNEIVETKEVMEKRTDEIEEATNARHKEMGEQYEDFLVSAKENAEKSIEQITESYLKKRLKKLIVRRKYYLSKSKRDQAVLVDGSSLIHMGNMQGIKRLQHLYTTFLPLLFQ